MPQRLRPQLEQLNAQQRDAVTAPAGPVLVLAGAGTGKTRVITVRIAHLIDTGVAPQNIAAMTFTNKAAREMRERLDELLGRDTAQAITMGTFHSFGARLLRRHADRLGFNRNFDIASSGYQKGLVQSLLREMSDPPEGDSGSCLARISRLKSGLLTPDDVQAAADTVQDSAVGELYRLYEARLHSMDLLDFDDLLVLVIRLWREHTDLLELHRERYRHILVDEYQDTNTVQFQLTAMLAGPEPDICVVGDDDQSIYGWRGAEVGNILRFGQNFPGATVIRLEQNYRSTRTILSAANHVIAENAARHPKNLWSEHESGDRLLAVCTTNENEEAQFVADMLLEQCTLRTFHHGSFAVLYRSNHQSRLLEQHMRRKKIPYTVVGTRSFFERKEILDTVSLLHSVANPRDDLSLLRILNVPPRGIGEKAIAKMKEKQRVVGIPLQRVMVLPEFLSELTPSQASALRALDACLKTFRTRLAQGGNLARKIRELLDATGYVPQLARMYKPREDALRRKENIDEFVNAVAEFEADSGPGTNLRDFLESSSLMDDNDRTTGTGGVGGAVTLLTVHASKGLEFPFVFVVGLEQGLFPHRQCLKGSALEEERRLFYVALTRAQRRVVLTHASRRRVLGTSSPRRPSQFLNELPKDLVDFVSPDDALAPAPPEVAADYLAQMRSMFAPPGQSDTKEPP